MLSYDEGLKVNTQTSRRHNPSGVSDHQIRISVTADESWIRSLLINPGSCGRSSSGSSFGNSAWTRGSVFELQQRLGDSWALINISY